MNRARLEVQLESELPSELSVGGGSALFVCGWCFCPQAEITELAFVLNDRPQPVAARAMPRLDPFRAMHPELDPAAPIDRDPGSADPDLRSYRSGFWGLVRFEPEAAADAFQLSLRARLHTGEVVEAPLARIAARAAEQPVAPSWPEGGSGPRVAIAMATYNPPPDLLGRQLDSIRAQTHRNWVCVISDDCSQPEHYARLQAAVADDDRFVVSRSPRRLGFYRNFERALTLVAGDADYIALADQDDIWRPEKLTVLLEALGGAQLVYSDARVVGADGELLSSTWWSRRRNNHTDLLSLLVANSVTGAASLLRRELLADALPFPPAQFAHFHDHWIGLTALSLGDVAFVSEPLYDYVQHREASLGHEAANRFTSLRERLAHQRAPRDRVQLWRLHYFVDIWRLRQFAAVLLLRCGPRMTPGKRRTLERFLDGDDSLGLWLTLGARGARELVGTPETLGAEWGLFNALSWRRLVGLSARSLPQRHLRLDALPPPSLVQEPGRGGLEGTAGEIERKVAPLRWRVADDAPRRVNLLIPSIDLDHFFGGYIAKFNLARRLAQRGLRVRIVTVDPVGPLPADWRRRIESYAGLEGLGDAVEVAFGRESGGLECSRGDGFIATTWWTALIAAAALHEVDATRFVYLIQEYEPFTFAMGTYAALAAASYDSPHFAVFSSELLRGYFRAHAIGVYAAGTEPGDRDSVAFQNAITRLPPVTAEELARRGTRRLLFYARPEAHAARNMFELGVLALARATGDGTFAGGWELNGVGAVRGGGGRIALGTGAAVRLLPRRDQVGYAELLRGHDVGLALMYTPHPSLVPLEMASAGMVTVTNSFENKTAKAMAAISSNLITVAPTVDGVAAGLRAAAAQVADADARAAGAAVDWSTSWADSFPDALVDRIAAALDTRAGA